MYLKNLKLAIVVSWLTVCSLNAQNPNISLIYGTPDAYQRYLVFNKSINSEIRNFKAEIFERISNSDTTYFKSLGAQSTRNGEEYMRINPYFFENDTTALAIKVYGLNGVGDVVEYDEWIDLAPYPATSWRPLCSSVCNGQTYAYKIEVMEEYNINTDQPLNNGISQVRINGSYGTYAYHENDDIYSPLYRYMRQSEWISLVDNSQAAGDSANSYLNWNTFPHYGYSYSEYTDFLSLQTGMFDGVKIMKIPNQTTGNYRDMNYQWIPDDVYAIQKSLGHYKNFDEVTEISQTSAQHYCGQLVSQDPNQEITNFTLLANSILDLDTVILSCNGLGYDTPPDGSGPSGHGGWRTLVQYHKSIYGSPPPTVGNGTDYDNVYDYMEFLFEEFQSTNNTTGVLWWPGDEVKFIQIYKIRDDRTEGGIHEPITIFKDSLFDSNGTPINVQFNLNKGLYSLVLHFESNVSLPYIFETVSFVENEYPLENYIDVNVFPVPFGDESLTTSIESEVPITIHYTVYDDNAKVYFDKHIEVLPNRELRLFIDSDEIKKGLVFHKFEFKDNSNIILNTIKE